MALTTRVSAQALPNEADLLVLFTTATIAQLTPASPEADIQGREFREAADQAQARGELGEMRRNLTHAIRAFQGQSWTPPAELTASLAIRTTQKVLDPQTPLVIELTQYFPTAFKANDDTQVRLTLASGTLGNRREPPPRKLIRELGQYPLLSRDLIDTPFRATADLNGVPDGVYEVVAALVDGATVVAESSTVVQLVNGFWSTARDTQKRVALIEGHESLQASILFPFDLARTYNQGIRRTLNYSVAEGMKASRALLESMEHGEDTLWQTRGDHERHYWFAAANRYDPYRLYVPDSWDGRQALPLVMLLHGSTGDHNEYFNRPGPLKQLAERYKFAVVGVFGYRDNSVYGNHVPVVLADGSKPPSRPTTIDGVVLPAHGHQPEPAELAALAVIDALKKEFPIDARRIYLAGNSMGGEGTWHLAGRYPEVWAAIAPGAGGLDAEQVPFDVLKTIPVLAVHGERDPIVSFAASKAMVDELKRRGGKAQMLAVRDGEHGAFSTVLPEIFAFFARHQRRD